VLATGFAFIKCADALPCPVPTQVSGFPNMNAVALEDGTGQTFVGTFDFIKVSLVTRGIRTLMDWTARIGTSWLDLQPMHGKRGTVTMSMGATCV